MPPFSSMRRNCFYSIFELIEGGGGKEGVGIVCGSILCALQVLKMKKKCVTILSLLWRVETGHQLLLSYIL
jgi:hypothetical protein